MSVMIQVRNVPERVHRTLKARSALAGKSLSDFIREELVSLAAIPSEEELRARIRDAEPFAMKKTSASIVRQERDAA